MFSVDVPVASEKYFSVDSGEVVDVLESLKTDVLDNFTFEEVLSQNG